MSNTAPPAENFLSKITVVGVFIFPLGVGHLIFQSLVSSVQSLHLGLLGGELGLRFLAGGFVALRLYFPFGLLSSRLIQSFSVLEPQISLEFTAYLV